MIRSATSSLASAAILAALLAACSNPYALRLSKINYAAPQTAGVIQFTDPKLYKREALINERRTEMGYLDGLLKDSAKPEFKIEPEIVRELEVVRAFSAAVSLKFDPAGAIEARRANEVGDIEQRIHVTRLEMQLAQLQRDAELLRDRLAKQAEPTAEVGAPPTSVTKPVAGPTPPDIANVFTAIETLRKSVAARLDADAKPPAKTSGLASPVEEFRDRRAYRDAIKDAMNAVNLDELHDMGGNSLFRVQLQATALPGGDDHLDTLGILRMEVVPPVMDEEAIRRLYQQWLWHVNQTLNLGPVDESRPLEEWQLTSDPRHFTLGEAGNLFKIVKIEIDKMPGTDAPRKAACKGVQKESRDVGGCWYPQIALPGPRGDRYTDTEFVLDLALQHPGTVIQYLSDGIAATRDKERLGSKVLELDASCGRFSHAQAETQTRGTTGPPTVSQTLALARTVYQVRPILANTLSYVADLPLETASARTSISDGMRAALRSINDVGAQARDFLVALGATNPRCKDRLLRVEPIEVPREFRSAVQEPGRVSVYEVAPTERTQRVSTAARAADAVAMAVALAGTLPQAGFGGSGNFAFTRTTIGKADALERAPLVVGFAEPVQAKNGASEATGSVFGWLLGPKVTLDPKKQRLVLQHHLAPYEIHADISLPGWWPYFDLKASTAWAPNWRSANSGTTLALAEDRYERHVRVPMRHNPGDMDGLTSLVVRRTTGQHVDRPRIRSIVPSAVSRCAGQATVAIFGEGIWRAAAVHVGGRQLQAGSIQVLPDMRGVAVTIDVDKIPVVAGGQALVQVWTHNGYDSRPLDLTDVRQADGKCGPPSMVANPPKNTPAIDEIVPAQISLCERAATFTVRGKNLGGPLAAALGTIPGMASDVPPGDGTLIKVDVAVSERASKIGKLTELPLVVRTAAGVASRPVTVVPSDCPPEPGPALPAGQPSIAQVTPDWVSVCDPDFVLTVRGRGFTNVKAVALGTIPAVATEVEPNDGSTLAVRVKNDQAPKKINELDQLTLMVRTAQGLASTPVRVRPGKCQ